MRKALYSCGCVISQDFKTSHDCKLSGERTSSLAEDEWGLEGGEGFLVQGWNLVRIKSREKALADIDEALDQLREFHSLTWIEMAPQQESQSASHNAEMKQNIERAHLRIHGVHFCHQGQWRQTCRLGRALSRSIVSASVIVSMSMRMQMFRVGPACKSQQLV